MMRSRSWEKVFFTILGAPAAICLTVFFWITSVLLTGIGTIRLNLLTTSALQGGLFEMIVGTAYLLLGAAGVAGPVGVFAAIHLTEYARHGRLIRVIDQAINNLAGMPSILIGLFGYAFFCRQLGLGISLASGWLTLALMMLPIVIRGTEEAIKMVPYNFKEAALALGASKWETVKSVTVPSAAPGIITSILLGMARVAGETAAILFTSCVLVTRGLPKSPFEPVMALAFNLFVKIVALGESPDKVFGIALILFLLVISFASVGIALRIYYRRKQPWLR
ncbi:MAG: phosphate ABC transporter permease PstA [Candidatus Bathyarchaeota archaeon]|nr:phosphate ABC transporter permease PstA [Candidatus Bathyarchaeota archaeon]MCX8176691.1 phosphate ABC transporter permease PstA [Candidatus Bathyarchaeota archaeon]MDW8193219.1 phosphate ABC transporter permease PstA [Nitrososphaerota archaeon]